MRNAIGLLPALAALLTLAAPHAHAGARSKASTQGRIRRLKPRKQLKQINFSAPHIVSAALHNRGIPLGAYRPKAPKVFGKRTWIIGCPSKSIIRRVMRKHLAAFRACYRRYTLPRFPKRGGRVAVRFVIDPRGRVVVARVKTSALRHKPTERCLKMRLLRMRFPPIRTTLVVSYPFVFKPK